MRLPIMPAIRFAFLTLVTAPWLPLPEIDVFASDTKKGAKASNAMPAGKPMLWKDPGKIEDKNLVWGNGSKESAPAPPFTFVQEDTSGTTPKIEVKDSRGTLWNVKFGKEVHSEVAASRLVWAFGYVVEEQYHVHAGKVEGVKSLDRARKSIQPDGSFQHARFEKRAENVIRTKQPWDWENNPFVGTPHLSGLKILMALINNWDTSSRRNNRILRVKLDDGTVQDWYVVSDLGASFGKSGAKLNLTKSKWNLDHYRKQAFVEGVEKNSLDVNYGGRVDMDKVPMEHARWFAAMATRLRREQVRSAFEAAGATPEEIEGYTVAVAGRLQELVRITQQ